MGSPAGSVNPVTPLPRLCHPCWGLQGILGLFPGRFGQLSGMVEPLAGIFGALAVVLAEPLLPYALGFAAGAMVYVVMDDIIPEAQTR